MVVSPMAWLRVADNGPGIAAEHLSHLFDRFYQVDRARTRSAEDAEGHDSAESESSGSGLGLSIVKWIVDAHEGQVHVESELGVGTSFEVRLPLTAEKESTLKPVEV